MSGRGWGGRIFTMQRNIWRREAERARRVAAIETRLRNELGREPTYSEITRALIEQGPRP